MDVILLKLSCSDKFSNNYGEILIIYFIVDIRHTVAAAEIKDFISAAYNWILS